MIKELEIKNFQSIAKAKLELGNFTCLVGPSNVGKSAVVRAINSLVHNARGTDMVRHGTNECYVKAVLDDDTEVIWHKGKRSRYEVDGEIYDKIGLDVPDIVIDRLRMSSKEVGGEKVNMNIHSQFSGPFFISESAPTRSKIVGTITHYDAIQEAVSEAQKTRKQLLAELTSVNRDITTVDVTIADLAPVLELEGEVEAILEYERKLNLMRTGREQLKALRDDLARARKDLDDAQNVLDNLGAIHEVEAEFNHIQSLRDEYIEAKNLRDAIGALGIQLSNNLSDIKDHKARILLLNNGIEALEYEISNLEDDSPRICPTCGQEIKN